MRGLCAECAAARRRQARCQVAWLAVFAFDGAAKNDLEQGPWLTCLRRDVCMTYARRIRLGQPPHGHQVCVGTQKSPTIMISLRQAAGSKDTPERHTSCAWPARKTAISIVPNHETIEPTGKIPPPSMKLRPVFQNPWSGRPPPRAGRATARFGAPLTPSTAHHPVCGEPHPTAQLPAAGGRRSVRPKRCALVSVSKSANSRGAYKIRELQKQRRVQHSNNEF
jgi:hypothetical protein